MRRADGQPVTVLVVDDEPVLAEMVSMALRYEGWNITTAGDGSSAIAAARRQRPDVVVLDVMLPDMSGLDVLHKLRSENPGLPVLLLTAKDAVEDRIAGLTAGGDDYVTKPFSIEEVVLRLRALLRRTGVTTVDSGAQLVVGDLVLDEDSHEVMRAGEPVSLTSAEVVTPDAVQNLGFAQHPLGAVHLVPAQKDRQRSRTHDSHAARRRLCAQAGPLAVREFGRFGCGSWSDRLSSSPWCVWESPRQPKWRCVVIWWHNLTTNSAERRTARC